MSKTLRILLGLSLFLLAANTIGCASVQQRRELRAQCRYGAQHTACVSPTGELYACYACFPGDVVEMHDK